MFVQTQGARLKAVPEGEVGGEFFGDLKLKKAPLRHVGDVYRVEIENTAYGLRGSLEDTFLRRKHESKGFRPPHGSSQGIHLAKFRRYYDGGFQRVERSTGSHAFDIDTNATQVACRRRNSRRDRAGMRDAAEDSRWPDRGTVWPDGQIADAATQVVQGSESTPAPCEKLGPPFRHRACYRRGADDAVLCEIIIAKGLRIETQGKGSRQFQGGGTQRQPEE